MNDAAAALISRYTFMSGWELSVEPPSSIFEQYDYLLIKATLPDSRKPGSTVKVAHKVPIPPTIWDDPEYFEHWLLHALDNVWRHEVREWLRKDGELVADPHKSTRQVLS